MNRKIQGLLAVLALSTGCEFAKTTSHDGPIAQCKPAGPAPVACTANAECCSYGCVAGVCARGDQLGSVCKTTSDCGTAPGTYTPMLCKSGRCATPVPYCRDLGDVCGLDSDCCGGDRCTGGSCAVNHAPVVDLGPSPVDDVPRRQGRTLFNATTDPDGDPLVFGWTLVSKPLGSTTTLSSVTARNPTVMPDLEGAYLFELTATDRPAPGLTSTGTVTLNVINTPPVVTPQAGVTNGKRNVSPVSISAVVNDPDGDDISCTWELRDPAGVLRGTVGPTGCFGTPGVPDDVTVSVPFPTGLLPADEGTWRATIRATDGNRTTSADVLVTVGNDPPVPAVSRTPYYANLAAIPADTAPVILDASTSTDPNGDEVVGVGRPGLSYFWEMVSASDSGALPTITGFDTVTPSFAPTRAADYILRLTVTDPPSPSRAGASSTLLVTVKVGRYIPQLAHDVIDSAYAKDVDKLILAGHDQADATKGMIWIYDAATGTEGTGIRLVDPVDPTASGIPSLVDVTPDGTKVVIADQGVSVWVVTLGTTPSMKRLTRPFPVGDLVAGSNKFAYLFMASPSNDYVRELDLNTATSFSPIWPGNGAFGTAYSVGSVNYVYRVDTTFQWFERYSVNASGASTSYSATASWPTCGGYPEVPATAIWATRNSTFANAYVISSCGQVYSATSLVNLSQPLGLFPSHVDSTTGGAVLAVNGTSIALFNSTLQDAGTDTVPPWAENGFGRTASISKAFFNSGATRRFAVVSDSASPRRYGLVIFP
jgi:hypothetical protein